MLVRASYHWALPLPHQAVQRLPQRAVVVQRHEQRFTLQLVKADVQHIQNGLR